MPNLRKADRRYKPLTIYMKILGQKKRMFKVILFTGFTIILFTIGIGCDINKYSGAGSYPYAETYLISAPEQRVIKAVNFFKAKYPETLVPIKNVFDGRRDSSDHWYHIYFYLPQENVIVYCWTRPEDVNQTTFEIVGINEGLELGNWKDINKDFDFMENKKILKNIEEKLLNPIKKILHDNSG